MGFIERLTRRVQDHLNGVHIGQAYTGERTSPRYEATIYVRYDGTGVMVARRGNVGIGGFCFEGERLYDVDCELELIVQLKGTDVQFSARGRVLGHTDAAGFLGVRGQFSHIDFQAERHLARWIDARTLCQQFPQVA